MGLLGTHESTSVDDGWGALSEGSCGRLYSHDISMSTAIHS